MKGPRMEQFFGDLVNWHTGELLRAASKREADFGERCREDDGDPGVFRLDGVAVFVRRPGEALRSATPPPPALRDRGHATVDPLAMLHIPHDFTRTLRLDAKHSATKNPVEVRLEAAERELIVAADGADVRRLSIAGLVGRSARLKETEEILTFTQEGVTIERKHVATWGEALYQVIEKRLHAVTRRLRA